MNLMHWIRSHFGRPPNPLGEGTDPAVERSRHERKEADLRLRLLEAQVQAVTRDPNWRAAPRTRPPHTEQSSSGEAGRP